MNAPTVEVASGPRSIGSQGAAVRTQLERMQQEIQGLRRTIRAQQRPDEEMKALFREERERDSKLLASGRNGDKVGAFEGAM